MRPCRSRVAALVVVLVAWTASSVGAQVTAQVPLEFDFLNPGARSLSMGSAFVGAADDATSAFANPAGLGFITTLEVSVEGRFRRTEAPFLQGGRLSGTVTGRGLDTQPDPVYGSDVDRQVVPAFMSILVPLSRLTSAGGMVSRISVAGYRHQVAALENAFFSEGAFERASFAGETNDKNRDLPLGGTRRVRIAGYGGAIGYDVNGRVSVGASATVYTFDLESSFASFGFTSNVFSPADRGNVMATSVQDGSDVGFAGAGGVLWRSAATATPTVKLGLTFRQGPSFRFTQTDRSRGRDGLIRSGRFKVPDVFAAGAEWRVSDSLRLVGDYDYVRYSQLKRDFIGFQAVSGREAQLRLDDGHELHAGMEYLILNLSRAAPPLALRAGAWLEAGHSVRHVPTTAIDTLDVRLSAALPGSSDVVHYTFGVGVVLGKLELNAGADLSSRTKYGTLSGMWRF